MGPDRHGWNACMLAALAAVSCRTMSTATPAVAGSQAADSGAPAVEADFAPVLPEPCVEFLSQLRCWLRAAGNGDGEVERAVGNARAHIESWSQRDETCEQAMVHRSQAIGAAGCSHVPAATASLPASVRAECSPGEYFFVRRDGHVSGCQRDCTFTSDCPSGKRCESTGTAAGGPIDEAFCE
jgi:hypothetical protein